MLQLQEFIKISLTDMGRAIEINVSIKNKVIVIDTAEGYQLIVHNNRIVRHNIFSNMRLVANSIIDSHSNSVIWIENNLIRIQDSDEFLKYIDGKSAFPFHGNEIKVDRRYFIEKGFYTKYLKKRNLLIVLGWIQMNYPNNFRQTPCLTIWDLKNGNKEFEYHLENGIWLTKLDLSSDEEYLFVGTEWEWQDLYIFKLSDFSLVYQDGGISETGGYEGCFFDNKYLIAPTNCYDGWTGNFRYFDLVTQNIINIFHQDEVPQHSYSSLTLIVNKLLMLEDGVLKIYKLKEMLRGRLVSVPFEFQKSSEDFLNENISSYYHENGSIILLINNTLIETTITISDD